MPMVNPFPIHVHRFIVPHVHSFFPLWGEVIIFHYFVYTLWMLSHVTSFTVVQAVVSWLKPYQSTTSQCGLRVGYVAHFCISQSFFKKELSIVSIIYWSCPSMHYDQITLKQIVKTSTRLSIRISCSEFILLLSIHRYKDFIKSAQKNKQVCNSK